MPVYALVPNLVCKECGASCSFDNEKECSGEVLPIYASYGMNFHCCEAHINEALKYKSNSAQQIVSCCNIITQASKNLKRAE